MSAFEKLVRQILKTKKQVDSSLQQLQKVAAKIDRKYEPRREFERWRNSTEGKRWKQQQWQKQSGCCANCHSQVELFGSHIDHIKLLSRYPQLALDPSNLRILCPNCNLHKGSQCRY